MFTPGFTPFHNVGSGGGSLVASVLRALLGLGPVEDSILLYWQQGDGTDYSIAYDRAIAAGVRTLMIPEGEYDWLTPRNYVNGVQILGPKEMKTSGVTGAKINAPNGFLKNANTTRKQIVVKNLHIIGDATESTVGIDGPFGGVIEGCKIEFYPDLIRNLSGYLCFYRRNAFNEAARGINTADANGTVVEQNHFDSSVLVQVTTRDGTPQTGSNSGQPLIIRENNFNMGDPTTVACKVRGQVKIVDNYFEDFGTEVIAKTFIDLEVNRFDLMGVTIEGNSMNGQGNGTTAFFINGSHSNLDNYCNGYIRANYVLGCAHEVVYGSNNRIPGLKIVNHRGLTVENSYRNQHVDESEAWAYVRLSSDFTTSSGTAVDITGMGFTPAADAQYIVEGMLMVRSATGGSGTTGIAPQPGIVWPTNVGDGTYYVQQASSATATVPRYGGTGANLNSGIDSIADSTTSWPIKIETTFFTLSNVSGDMKLTVKSESAGTNVTVRAGSWFRYRRLI